ncbi:hypothetical protein Pelo_9193 [Pelomyxa schiedti]|nr:hypothetical protein Pelo_9193 [Pelomyxa schiedti]
MNTPAERVKEMARDAYARIKPYIARTAAVLIAQYANPPEAPVLQELDFTTDHEYVNPNNVVVLEDVAKAKFSAPEQKTKLSKELDDIKLLRQSQCPPAFTLLGRIYLNAHNAEYEPGGEPKIASTIIHEYFHSQSHLGNGLQGVSLGDLQTLSTPDEAITDFFGFLTFVELNRLNSGIWGQTYCTGYFYGEPPKRVWLSTALLEEVRPDLLHSAFRLYFTGVGAELCNFTNWRDVLAHMAKKPVNARLFSGPTGVNTVQLLVVHQLLEGFQFPP